MNPNQYPADREADVVLRDGSTVQVRPVQPADEPRLLAFLRQDPSVNAPAGETLKRMEELAAAIPGGAS